MVNLKISKDLQNMQMRNLKVYSYAPYAPRGKLYYASYIIYATCAPTP